LIQSILRVSKRSMTCCDMPLLPIKANLRHLCKNNADIRQLHTKADVVIAGGGMVGSAMAASLAKKGAFKDKKILMLEGAPHKDITVESASEFGNRVSALNHTTKDLLESLGAWNLIEQTRVKQVDKMQIWESNSDAVISFENENNKPLNYMVENDVTQMALNHVINELADNLTVMYNSRIKSYQLPIACQGSNLPEEMVKIHLETGDVIETDTLIGADGFKSLVRQTMGCQYMAWEYKQMGIVATLELCQPCENNTAWQRFLPTGPIAVLPLSDKFSSLVWTADTAMAKELIRVDENDFVDRLNHGLHDSPTKDPLVETITTGFQQVLSCLTSKECSEKPPVIKSARSRAAFPFGFGHSTKYIAPRCAVIGDAAHRIHPLAGQGVNLGFGDVTCLANLLEASVRDGAGLGHYDYLRQYETDRQQHNFTTMLGVDSLQKLYSTSFPPIVLARSLGLQATNAIQPIKKLFVAHAA